jgi:hypothetical protein
MEASTTKKTSYSLRTAEDGARMSLACLGPVPLRCLCLRHSSPLHNPFDYHVTMGESHTLLYGATRVLSSSGAVIGILSIKRLGHLP